MERSHTPLSVWFWAAYLVASQTLGMSAVQFQRNWAHTYDTAFGLLQNCARDGAAGPGPDRGSAEEHVEVDEAWVGGRTRGEGRGIDHKTLAAAAVEVRLRKPGTAQNSGGLPLCRSSATAIAATAAPIPCVALSRMPSCQAR